MTQQFVLQFHFAAFIGIGLQALAQELAHLRHIFTASHFLGEHIVQLIRGLHPDGMDHAVEFGVLTGQGFGMVLLREGNLDDNLFLGDLVHQLLFKAGNKHAAAQDQGLVLGGAACKLLAITITGIVQNHFISQLGGTILNDGDAGILLPQAFQIAVDLFFCDDVAFQLGLQAPVSKAHGK